MQQRPVVPTCLPRAVVCVGLLAAAAAPRAAVPVPAEPARLQVALGTPGSLADGVDRALTREVETVWGRAGVAIAWTLRLNQPAATPGIRVLVVSTDGASTRRTGHSWPVARLLRDGAGRPVAIASVSAARRVLEAARAADGPRALVARRLGLVLGRAVAHEIGHYLLNTAHHAGHGLMRARIAARDFVDPRDGGFDLEPGAALWAQAVLSREATDMLRVTRFVYAP